MKAHLLQLNCVQQTEGVTSLMKTITQDMKYRCSPMKYREKYGVSRASRKYNRSQPYICFWKKRYGGMLESLACESRRPHDHARQHTEEERTLIRPCMPRHNVKAERSHCEDQKRFCAARQSASNSRPPCARPVGLLPVIVSILILYNMFDRPARADCPFFRVRPFHCRAYGVQWYGIRRNGRAAHG